MYRSHTWCSVGLGLALAASAFARAQQTVTFDIDASGVPHVRATTDRGAFYGAGTGGARSMLAFGQSEHDASPFAYDQQPLWEQGGLKPSPTSVAGVAAYGIVTTIVRSIP